MASGPFPCLGLPPHRLWALRPGVYEDERGRTWVIVVVRLSPSWRAQGRAPRHHAHEPSITVHIWQMPVHPQVPMLPSELTLSQLPFTWQLHPGGRYRAMDSRLWEIEDHGQVDSTEQLILTQLPPGND
ncbi:T-cell leukemia/lymphoma protein 1B [Vulpes vulpes]|uniref:TCL1 family AKT coactivator B n=3 Tax=Canidae TaxID=9608 RepID=A0A8C0PT42_CANLF|nr:T-cell leukemia/lymphoma protein 1B [Canis lupus dingo]XP_025838377.1 T-cell leukemia/lymphoma protein 1B [Vulpes vulpes]XP_038528936.1 T-cell leukemia/lymphoma protein 1B [Canis lupus familiaris]XP_041615101.1 T-cell leukemia/lymphoma protein 1B [Vulpes lagopus]